MNDIRITKENILVGKKTNIKSIVIKNKLFLDMVTFGKYHSFDSLFFLKLISGIPNQYQMNFNIINNKNYFLENISSQANHDFGFNKIVSNNQNNMFLLESKYFRKFFEQKGVEANHILILDKTIFGIGGNISQTNKIEHTLKTTSGRYLLFNNQLNRLNKNIGFTSKNYEFDMDNYNLEKNILVVLMKKLYHQIVTNNSASWDKNGISKRLYPNFYNYNVNKNYERKKFEILNNIAHSKYSRDESGEKNNVKILKYRKELEKENRNIKDELSAFASEENQRNIVDESKVKIQSYTSEIKKSSQSISAEYFTFTSEASEENQRNIVDKSKVKIQSYISEIEKASQSISAEYFTFTSEASEENQRNKVDESKVKIQSYISEIEKASQSISAEYFTFISKASEENQRNIVDESKVKIQSYISEIEKASQSISAEYFTFISKASEENQRNIVDESKVKIKSYTSEIEKESLSLSTEYFTFTNQVTEENQRDIVEESKAKIQSYIREIEKESQSVNAKYLKFGREITQGNQSNTMDESKVKIQSYINEIEKESQSQSLNTNYLTFVKEKKDSRNLKNTYLILPQEKRESRENVKIKTYFNEIKNNKKTTVNVNLDKNRIENYSKNDLYNHEKVEFYMNQNKLLQNVKKMWQKSIDFHHSVSNLFPYYLHNKNHFSLKNKLSLMDKIVSLNTYDLLKSLDKTIIWNKIINRYSIKNKKIEMTKSEDLQDYGIWDEKGRQKQDINKKEFGFIKIFRSIIDKISITKFGDIGTDALTINADLIKKTEKFVVNSSESIKKDEIAILIQKYNFNGDKYPSQTVINMQGQEKIESINRASFSLRDGELDRNIENKFGKSNAKSINNQMEIDQSKKNQVVRQSYSNFINNLTEDDVSKLVNKVYKKLERKAMFDGKSFGI